MQDDDSKLPRKGFRAVKASGASLLYPSYFDSMGGLGASASKSHEAAFDAIPEPSGAYDVFIELAKNAKTDAQMEKVISATEKCREQDAETTQHIVKANADNNEMFKYLAYGITGAALVAGGYGYYLANKKDED
ncbi:hypothetical protein RRJ83_000470 [Vibrio parahaemolyticus]|nr:hypothetical protein [Vibrio parahaemolyticus]ELI5427414.1 hypothetical protein [Vibrio parahaemolyticus]